MRHIRSKFRELNACAVRPRPGERRQGLAAFGPRVVLCALGAAGPIAVKREGDGGTPAGRWRLTQVLYRADRLARPRTRLPVRAISPRDGWCDDPHDRNYNRPVRLPYPASAEAMWRDDPVYDIVVILDHNTRPRARGRGSAVFIHLAREGFPPTAGCVALPERELRALLRQARPGDGIVVLP